MASALSNNPSDRSDALAYLGGLLVLGASQNYDPSLVNDSSYNEKINQSMAKKILDLNLNRDDQIKVISSILSVLNSNYDNNRNVTTE